jgi:hypothetical protein
MPMWVWILIGLGSSVGLSVLVGFALARVFRAIGRQISDLYESEAWATLPPTRAANEGVQRQSSGRQPKPARPVRAR